MIRVLSLGAGVQSTTVLLMSCRGVRLVQFKADKVRGGWSNECAGVCGV